VKYRNKKYPNSKALKKAHLNYPDIMSRGWENYTIIKPRLQATLKDIPDGCNLLDVGCNSGEMGLMFQQVNGCKITGIDISKKLVRLAKAKGINARVGDAECLPFSSATFDCVYLGEMVEHSYNPDVVLIEARRVLKPGGRLVGNTMNEAWFIAQGDKIQYHWDDTRLHAKAYSTVSMRKLLNRYFDNVSAYHLFYITSVGGEPNINSWIMFKGFK